MSAGSEEEAYHQGTASMSTAAGLGEDAGFIPAPPPAPRVVIEPAREIPVHAETEVLVVGGGPAGCAAALAARRAGAEVLLVERYNHLGGLSTGGLVIWIDRMTDWTGRPVIAGIGQELLDRLPDDAVAGAPRALWGSTDPEPVAHWRERQGAFRNTVTWSPMIDPEWLKYLSAELLIEAGVKLLLHSWVASALLDGRVLRGVSFESKAGRRAVLADVVVDATGDLDLCARAGLEFEADAKTGGGGIAHCLNTGWLWAGVDFARWLEFKRSEPDAYRQLMADAGGELGFVERPVVGWSNVVALFLGPRLSGYSGVDVSDLTRVEVESRRHMSCDPQTQAFMREIPQCWLTGQAAGVAAAMAASAGIALADVDVGGLQRELRCQGVYLRGADGTGAIAGAPPRGPKVSITADTPAL